MTDEAGEQRSTSIFRRRPPVESAAAAGVVYAVLAAISTEILRRVPDTTSQAEWAAWIGERSNRRGLGLALVLASVGSVALLWFVAVVRRRVGEREDRFFATVFLGSALVNIALWLAASAAVAALAVGHDVATSDVGVARYARGFSSALLYVAGPRIQAVFVASTSTVFLRTGVVPNWVAYLGYAAAAIMFFVPLVATPLGLGLPLFVLVSSLVILVAANRAR